MQYHPTIAYTFIPNVRARIPHEAGGYLVQVNGNGFRCNHEFKKKKQDGIKRVLLFGDSFTAGDGVSNHDRYGDLLEQEISHLEVYNFGLPGTGTDQQYLTYQEYAREIEHDLLIMGIMVENIVRVAAKYRAYSDSKGRAVFYAKPYYRVENGEIRLENVPVQKEPLQPSTLDQKEFQHVNWGVRFPRLRRFARRLNMRDFLQKITHFQPLPDYKNKNNSRWLLMKAILEKWINESRCPVILVPIPLFPYIEGTSDPSFYQARFRELSDSTRCVLHDPLPDLLKYSGNMRRVFRFQRDAHLSPRGHIALAKSLTPAVRRILERGKES